MATAAEDALREGEVHVWTAKLDLSGGRFESFARLLDPEEKKRASRFHFERDRRAFTAARGILRALLGRYLGDRPERIRFVFGPQGKPALGAEWAARSLFFNLSHSGSLALFAFSRSGPVGIDVERLRPQPDLDTIAQRFFSAPEVACLRDVPPAARDKAFFACWTAKEAYIKAIGGGLSIPLDRFSVGLQPSEGPVDLRLLDPQGTELPWRLFRFEPCSGYVAALAVEGPWFRFLSRRSFEG